MSNTYKRTFSVQERTNLPEDGNVKSYIVMHHRHQAYEAGEVPTPSVVICECDTREQAEIVLLALRDQEISKIKRETSEEYVPGLCSLAFVKERK